MRGLLGTYMSFLDDSQTPNVFGWAHRFVLGKPAGCRMRSSHLPLHSSTSTSPSLPLPAMHQPCTGHATCHTHCPPAVHLLSTHHPPTMPPALHPPCTRPP